MDIVEVIEQLEGVIGSATRVPGLGKRVVVDSERLTGVVAALQSSIPADIQEAKEILRQKESLLNQSQLEAKRIKEAAEREAQSVTSAAKQEQESKVEETEIVKEAHAKAQEVNQDALQESQQIIQDAQRRAYRIMDEAEAAAATRREGSDQYARETLFDLEERLSKLTGQVRRGIDALGAETEAKMPS